MREADTIELRWFFAVIRRRVGLIIGCTLLATSRRVWRNIADTAHL